MSNASQAWLRQDAMVGGDHKWLAGGDWTIEHYASLANPCPPPASVMPRGTPLPYSTGRKSRDWTPPARLCWWKFSGQTRYSTGRRQLQICPRIASP
jgi:hypothetical protein